MKFSGFVGLGNTLSAFLATLDSNNQPIAPDAAPTFRVYGGSGLLSLAGGTCTLAHTGAVTGATNVNPIVVTSAAHGLATGQRVTIAGVTGNTNANGTFVVTVIDANSFSIAVAGNGAYVSGGTWNVTGFYKASIVATGGNGFDVGAYAAQVAYTVSSAARADVLGFGVV